MHITYVARSLLDYRLPVLEELDKLCGGHLTYIASVKWTPERVLSRLQRILGKRAILLAGEKSIGTDMPIEANTTWCVPYQPGLARAIAASRPDVIVGDGLFQWTGAALWQRIRHGTPLVVCYERWAHTERHAQVYRRIYRKLALQFTNALSCNGNLSKDYVVSLGFSRDRITLGHMAADTESMGTMAMRVAKRDIQDLRERLEEQENERRFPIEQNLSQNPEQKAVRDGLLFLYVGRLIRIKGLKELLNGWAKFCTDCKTRGLKCTLVIIGSGPEEKNLKQQIDDLQLANVRFQGVVEYDGLPAYYAAADVFVIPTLEDNWSLVVPEAMACGLPILCSKYNGCWPELVKDGSNGWVFDPLDPQDVARCLNLCATQKFPVGGGISLHEMGEESKSILKEHTPRKGAEAIFSACAMAIAHRHRHLNGAALRQFENT